MSSINGNGQPVQAVAQVVITRLTDGSVNVQVQGPADPTLLYGMLEVAKQQLAGKLQEMQEQTPKIALPPAGLGEALRRLG